LRVIAGSAKKRILRSPRGWKGRPTADRIKEALFGILGELIIESSFMDLFAGTGGIGIEALSRGASKAVFIDQDRRAVNAIIQNLKLAGLEKSAIVMERDVDGALSELQKNQSTFNIVFIDPPYEKGLEVPAIEKILECNLLSHGGLVIVESSKRTLLPAAINRLQLVRQERYGDTLVSFYR